MPPVLCIFKFACNLSGDLFAVHQKEYTLFVPIFIHILISVGLCIFKISGIVMKYRYELMKLCHIFHIISNLQLGLFSYLKTIVSGNVLLVITSNQLKCCIMHCSNAG